jgi:4-diphosphocytidyl-2-C-methyl-D-erythritol kinase
MPEREAVGALMKQMTDTGAVFARMSGSGPSVVGYFEDENTAASCVAQLAKKGVVAHLCRPLN